MVRESVRVMERRETESSLAEIGSASRNRRKTASATPVPTGAGNRQRSTGLLDPYEGTELIHGGHDYFSPLGVSAIGSPNSLATFF